ncbi:MAG TPA: hypothetical protein VF889_08150 [Bacteroidota bacterium]
MAQRTFVGVGWETRFAGGGSSIAISVNLEKIAALQKDDYGNVRLVVGERREQDERSRATHWVAVDDYHYRRSAQAGPPVDADAGALREPDEGEQLPF